MDNWIYIMGAIVGSGASVAFINWLINRRASNVDILKAMNDYNKDVTGQVLSSREEILKYQEESLKRIIALLSDSTALRSAQLQLDVLTAYVQAAIKLCEELEAELVRLNIDGSVAKAVAELLSRSVDASGSADDIKKYMGETAVRIAEALQTRQLAEPDAPKPKRGRAVRKDLEQTS